MSETQAGKTQAGKTQAGKTGQGIHRRGFIRLLGGGGVVLAAAGVGLTRCDRMPEEAVAGWVAPGHAEGDVRRRALSHAILAPNPHNMQPWAVDLRGGDRLVLYVDRDRVLPETDPFGRQVMIGHGCFLELLTIAAAEFGMRADVTLFPDGMPGPGPVLALALDKPVASVRFSADPLVAKDPLFRQITRRRSHKDAYDMERPVTAGDIDGLRRIAQEAGSGLRFGAELSPDGVADLRALARAATEIELHTPRTLQESIDRIRIGAGAIARHRDGIDMHGPLFWWLKTLGMMEPQDMATPGTMAWQGGRDYAMGYIDGTPAYGWIITPGNDRAAQIHAGRTYARMNLAATARGLAMHPNSQALQEFPEMAAVHQAIHQRLGAVGETVQMFFRLGHAALVPPSPRRPLDAIVRA